MHLMDWTRPRGLCGAFNQVPGQATTCNKTFDNIFEQPLRFEHSKSRTHRFDFLGHGKYRVNPGASVWGSEEVEAAAGVR